MKKPRPDSSGFHHQPLSGWLPPEAGTGPPGPNAMRSIGTAPPGHTIVPCVASLNASVIAPSRPMTGVPGYGPPSVWPPCASNRSPEKYEPSSDDGPAAMVHVERPDAS